MRKKFLIIGFLLISSLISAQIHEVGVFLGGSNYIGDVGSEYYIAPKNFAGGFIYKYNLNPRVALRGTFTYTQLKSDDAKATNIARKMRGYNFSNALKEFAVGVEISYFDYGSHSRTNYATPYILLELAAFNYNVVSEETAPNEYNYTSATSYSIPFGLGYKTRLGFNFALGMEIGARYTFKDDLDYNNLDIPSLNFGNPDSNDWYVFTGINLVYTFGRAACYKKLQ